MESVMTNSGIVTKVRAMRKNLLKEEDFVRLSEQRLSLQKAEFLSTFKPYAELFQNVSAESLHRSGVERRLMLSLLQDFDRLYQFAGPQQRSFMKLYFGHYEVRMLNLCLQAALGGRPAIDGLRPYGEYLKKYGRIDILQLAESRSMAEYIENLNGTPYYSILKRLYESGHAKMVDYETAIEMRYFTSMWRRKDKELSKISAAIVAKTFGSRIDTMNMNWIYRSKKYFDMTPEELYALLIPIRYKLTVEDIRRMVEAPGLPELLEVERACYYGRKGRPYVEKTRSLTKASAAMLSHIYRQAAKDHPYSIAPVNTYFFLKEQEIRRIVNIIESTHYQDGGQKPAEEVLS